MFLHELRPVPGSKKRKKRKGFGIGSGHGKTACRGHKGQKARAGGGVPVWFEGGQMPLVRRIPKRGFNNARFRIEYEEVNISVINDKFNDGDEVTPELLRQKNIIKGKNKLVKVLGDGDITKKLFIKAHAFSKSAVSKIEAAGGKAEVI